MLMRERGRQSAVVETRTKPRCISLSPVLEVGMVRKDGATNLRDICIRLVVKATYSDRQQQRADKRKNWF